MNQLSLKKLILEMIETRIVDLGIVSSEEVSQANIYTPYKREILPDEEEIEIVL